MLSYRKERPKATKRMGKAKVVLVFFNRAPRHEGVLGDWRHNSTHYLPSVLDGVVFLIFRVLENEPKHDSSSNYMSACPDL
jgi:hypothetical protein